MASDPTAYPDATIVFITDTIAGQGWQGSGVLIAPDEVLTASHVVYNSIAGEASDITVTPAYDAGYAPYGSATGTTIHYEAIQDQNETISNAQSQFDFAVIHLSRPFADLGTMGLEANIRRPCKAGSMSATNP
jgi:V8-like Glu-specific endopeptidase